jgi:hydrogenase nickel incorporation protein HypB
MLGAGVPVAVIEGDQQTSQDAERIRATGAPAIQINTGKGCHLDAHMVGHAMEKLDLPGIPADDRERRQPGLPGGLRPRRGAQGGDPLGHRGRGQADQVPDMFRAASLMLLNKCDLLPYLELQGRRRDRVRPPGQSETTHGLRRSP